MIANMRTLEYRFLKHNGAWLVIQAAAIASRTTASVGAKWLSR